MTWTKAYTVPSESELADRGSRLIACACGCGKTFRKWGQRRFHPACSEQQHARRRAESYERVRAGKPRHCRCGCGRVCPKGLHYHPDCQARKAPSSAAARLRTGKQRCRRCEDMSWRRDQPNCPVCDQLYAPETESTILDYARISSAAEMCVEAAP